MPLQDEGRGDDIPTRPAHGPTHVRLEHDALRLCRAQPLVLEHHRNVRRTTQTIGEPPRLRRTVALTSIQVEGESDDNPTDAMRADQRAHLADDLIPGAPGD